MEFKNLPLSDPQRVLIASVFQIPEQLQSLIIMIDQMTVHGVNLGMINYHPNHFNPEDPAHHCLWTLKAVIMDLDSGHVYARSGGYVKSLPVTQPLAITDKGILVNGEERQEARLFVGYETVYLRLWKIGQTTFFSSQKRIDASKSKWVNTPLFYDLFKESLDISEDVFFQHADCHSFLLVTPHTNLASSILLSQLLYLGPSYELISPVQYNTFSVKQPMKNHHAISVSMANGVLFPKQFAQPTTEGTPGRMFVGDKVYFHPSGFEHPLLSGGDCVTMLFEGRLYRLEPPAFTFRHQIMNSNPTPYQEFCLGLAHDHEPLFEAPDPITYWHRLFVACAGPSLKKEAESYLQMYRQDLNNFVNFMVKEKFKVVPKDVYEHRFSKTARNTIDYMNKKFGTNETALRKYIGTVSMETCYTLMKQVKQLLKHGIVTY